MNIVKHEQQNIVKFSPEQVDLIKKQIAPNCSDDELKLFMYQCERTGLDPFARQIYAMQRRSKNDQGEWVNKMTVQTSIDGFRLIASRSDKYAGQTETLWCGSDGVWKDIWTDSNPPFAAKSGVYHKDFKEPLYAVARFDAYAQRLRDGSLNSMWSKMGDIMIAKCAEALALRKAFPNDLSGLYTTDEMAQTNQPEPIVKPMQIVIPKDGAFAKFEETYPENTIKIVDNKRVELGEAIKKEQIRLAFNGKELSKYIEDNFGKTSKELSDSEMELCLESLKRL